MPPGGANRCRRSSAGTSTALRNPTSTVAPPDIPRGVVPNFTLVDAWTAAGNTDPGHTWSARNPLVPRYAIHPHRRLDYVMVSTPRRPGAGHISRCVLAGHSAADNVWASDHFAVVAEVRM